MIPKVEHLVMRDAFWSFLGRARLTDRRALNRRACLPGRRGGQARRLNGNCATGNRGGKVGQLKVLAGLVSIVVGLVVLPGVVGAQGIGGGGTTGFGGSRLGTDPGIGSGIGVFPYRSLYPYRSVDPSRTATPYQSLDPYQGGGIIGTPRIGEDGILGIPNVIGFPGVLDENLGLGSDTLTGGGAELTIPGLQSTDAMDGPVLDGGVVPGTGTELNLGPNLGTDLGAAGALGAGGGLGAGGDLGAGVGTEAGLGVGTLAQGPGTGAGAAEQPEAASLPSQEELRAREEQRSALGIRVGRDPQGRILISEVAPGSPADEAGLQVGDEVVAIGQTPIGSTDQVVNLVQEARIGEPFSIQVRRDGQLITATGQLGAYTAYFGNSDWARGAERPALGIRVRENAEGQLTVTEVEPNSPAEAAGIRAGDVILAAGGEQVRSFDELTAALDQAQIGNPIRIQLRRNGQPLTVSPTVTSFAAMFPPRSPGGTERQVLRRPLDQQQPGAQPPADQQQQQPQPQQQQPPQPPLPQEEASPKQAERQQPASGGR